VTASVKTGRELVEHALLPRERISLIPLGPGRSHPRRPPAAPPTIKSIAGTTLRPPWLLVTGIDQPHKNFDFMLSAISLYFQRRPEVPPLVWVGLSEESKRRRSRQLPAHVKQKVALEPFASTERVEELYASAGALLFPSLDEGFGFPPLEAMTWGIPVICARREPMTTILGDAPLYFEPCESASLWRALDRLFDDADLRQELAQRGREVAAHYSWTSTAEKTFRLYYELIKRDLKEAQEADSPR
jgi:glycosyltransferase involved in cell wall biosynthesis